MRFQYNKNLKHYSQSNRANQTNAEKLLWYKLRNRQLDGIKFRRQFPLLNFILDFYCMDKKLAIELDGSQHANSLYDAERSKELQKLGITVIRFWDNDVLQNINEVLEKILLALTSS